MDRGPKPDGALELSLGERAAIARIEETLFGRSEGPVLLGRHEILSVLGTGAFGRVYRARDPQLDRPVALKVLTEAGAAGDPGARERLLREARTMATIADPNVATVYEAGVVGEGDDARVYLAMELVTGKSLRDWLAERRRSAREIVDVMRQAGRGLAAAHTAGVVHRDFKPENVLVGDDGRVRVVDFGLARPLDAGHDRQTDPGSAEGGLLRTVSGAVLGTPAYMAPEQHEGRTADAASDQFAYCVTFWEALFGERPFAGRDLAELGAVVRSGRRRAARGSCPAAVRRVVERGLAVSPAARYPSLRELLSALDRPRALWPWIVVALLAVAVFAVGGALLSRPAPAVDPCAPAVERLAGVWDQGRRSAVFSSLAAAVAGADAGTVVATLDRYAAGWVQGQLEACQATHVQHVQSVELLDRRIGCLEDRRRHLAAVVQVLEGADAASAGRALHVARALPSVASCADVAALVAGVAPIADEAARRRADALYDELARVAALHAAGRSPEALALVESLRPRAIELGYAPLEALASNWLADTLMAVGRQAEAVAAAREGFDRALAGSDERLAVHAATVVAFAGAFDPSRKEEALGWIRTGRALLQQLPGEDELEAGISNAEGNILLTAGDPLAARPPLERAVAAWTRLDPDHPDLGSTVAMLGVAELDSGALASARARLTDALARVRRTLGPEHPEVASTLVNLALAETSLGSYGAAESALRQALELQLRSYGEGHVLSAYTHLGLGEVLTARGADADAEAQLLLAERIALASYGPAHPFLSRVYEAQALLFARLGRLDDARARTEGAQQIVERALGAQSPELARILGTRARVERAAGHLPEALVFARRGLEAAFTAGEKNVRTAIARFELGETLLASGDSAAAADELGRAEELFVMTMPDPRKLSEVRFARARALVGRDPTAATQLARQALEGWPREGDPRFGAAIRAWIDAAR